MEVGGNTEGIGVSKCVVYTESLRALEDLATYRVMGAMDGGGWDLGVLLWSSWVAQGMQGDMGGWGCVEAGGIGAVGLQLGGSCGVGV